MKDNRCLDYCDKERKVCKDTWDPYYCDQFTECFLSYPISTKIFKNLFPNKKVFTNCFSSILTDIFSSAGYVAVKYVKPKLKELFNEIYDILYNPSKRISLIGREKDYVTSKMDLLLPDINIFGFNLRKYAKEKGLWNVVENFLNKLLIVYIGLFSSELDEIQGVDPGTLPFYELHALDDKSEIFHLEKINPYDLYPIETARKLIHESKKFVDTIPSMYDMNLDSEISKKLFSLQLETGFDKLKSKGYDVDDERLRRDITNKYPTIPTKNEIFNSVYRYVNLPREHWRPPTRQFSFNRKSKKSSRKRQSRSRRRSRKSEPASVQKTPYFYKERDGSFKPIYAHKYMKDFKASGRKSYFLNKKGPNPSSQTFHGKFYTKSEINKKSRK